ncbi:MAG: sel1 repeat family protein [Clostridia bacterium]|nr:sel1 repeat family protein [Clostridia bacterium]
MDTFEIIFTCGFCACAVGVIIALFFICRRKRGGSDSRSYREKKEEYANQLCVGLDGEGVYELALKYKEGDGVDRDIILSEELVKKSAELGYAQAQYEVGCDYDYEQNDLAIEWFEKAAAQEHEEAMQKLGDIYNYGRDTGTPVIEEDPEKALKYYLPLAEKGNVDFMKSVSLVYALGYEDEENALKWLAKAAEASGDLDDILQVAQHYSMDGDRENAIAWYKKAAEMDEAKAFYAIALEYERMDADPAEIKSWFDKAIAAGYTQAEVAVAFRLMHGEVFEKDVNKAFELFSKHAELGDSMGLYGLGLCYLNGESVSKDEKRAVEYFKKADNILSRQELIDCYLEGIGVEKDEKKAFEMLIEETSEKNLGGDSISWYKLGVCYFFGKGVESDKQKAKELWKKAAEWDHEDAIAALDKYFGITVNN